MAFQLDPDLPPDLAPVAWIVGRWEGAGVVGYPTMAESFNFGQELDVRHDGRPFLHWSSRTWLLDADGQPIRQSGTETGFLRIVPGGEAELLLAHPTGIIEMYFGPAEPAKLSLRTDSVVRSPHAKEYNAATRHYGLVNGDLMWVMDMAAMGTPLTSHLSAQLKRVG